MIWQSIMIEKLPKDESIQHDLRSLSSGRRMNKRKPQRSDRCVTSVLHLDPSPAAYLVCGDFEMSLSCAIKPNFCTNSSTCWRTKLLLNFCMWCVQ